MEKNNGSCGSCFSDEEDESRIHGYLPITSHLSPRSSDVYGASAACEVPTHDVSPVLFHRACSKKNLESLWLWSQSNHFSPICRQTRSLTRLSHALENGRISRIRQSASSLYCYLLLIKLIFMRVNIFRHAVRYKMFRYFTRSATWLLPSTSPMHIICFAAINVAKAYNTVVPGWSQWALINSRALWGVTQLKLATGLMHIIVDWRTVYINESKAVFTLWYTYVVHVRRTIHVACKHYSKHVRHTVRRTCTAYIYHSVTPLKQ